jgi:cyclopropane-fatty-acyl-phospholipid synthase
MWLLDRIARKLLKTGELKIIDADGKRYSYGVPDPGRAPIVMRLADAGVANYIARHPRLGAAEAWMDGRLIIEQGDIAGLIDLIRANGAWERGGGNLGARSPLKRAAAAATHRLKQVNKIARSKQNVAPSLRHRRPPLRPVPRHRPPI